MLKAFYILYYVIIYKYVFLSPVFNLNHPETHHLGYKDCKATQELGNM